MKSLKNKPYIYLFVSTRVEILKTIYNGYCGEDDFDNGLSGIHRVCDCTSQTNNTCNMMSEVVTCPLIPVSSRGKIWKLYFKINLDKSSSSILTI